MSNFSIRVIGSEQLQSALAQERYGGPFRTFFQKATRVVEAKARVDSPVDTGRTRAAHASEVDPSPLPMWGQVGVNVDYGLFVHDGTRPHFPPPAALEAWAGRHGMAGAGFAIARRIAQRGTKGRPWLRNALHASRGQIGSLLNELGTGIARVFGG